MAERSPDHERPPTDEGEIWGDDPEEIDASAVVDEFAEAFPETRAPLARPPRVRAVQSRWAVHPAQRQADSGSRSSGSAVLLAVSRCSSCRAPGWS